MMAMFLFRGYETAFLAVRYETGYETAVWNQGMKPGYETHESSEKARVETKVWNQSMKPQYETRYENRYETSWGFRPPEKNIGYMIYDTWYMVA